MKKLLTKILSVIVAVTATLGLVMLPKTAVQASEFTFGAVAGASVKYGETVDETGLRFTIEVDKVFYEGLGEGVEFGALLTTKKYASNNDVVIDPANGNIADVRYVTDSTKFDADQPEDATRFVYYASVTYKFDATWQEEVKALFGDDADIEAYKLQALATELVCRPYYVIGKEVVYAELSDARSMVKVANGAMIDGEKVPSDFATKYLSTLVESESKVYVEADGTIVGLSDSDKAALNGASITVDGVAEDIESAIDNDKLNAKILEGKELGNYYYVTAFKGYEVYRIKYRYVTKAIDEASDLSVFVLTGGAEGTAALGHDGYYVLTKDIDATGYVHGTHTYSNNGTTYPSSSDKGFKGTLDGNGYTISNFASINNGLFGQATAPVVKDIAFVGTIINGYYGSLFAHSINRDGWIDGTGYTKEAIFENVYIQIDKCVWGNSKRIGILANNTLPLSIRVKNFVVEYTNAKADGIYEKVYSAVNTYEFGIIGGSNNADMQKTLTFENAYAITDLPVMYTRGSNPYAAENQVEHTISNGYWIASVGAILDERYAEFLTAKGLTLDVHKVARGLRHYDNYAALSKDSEANAQKLETFNSKYWVVVNNVPYWKSCYDGTVELAIEDKDGNVVSPSTIILEDNATEYTVKLLDATHALSNLTITGEGLVQVGNKFKLQNNPTDKGTIEVTVVATVNGIEISRMFTVAYTNEIEVDGKVLYSDYDQSLDFPSLKKALAELGVEIISLDEIDGYIVNDEELEELDLEVIISGGLSGDDRAVDTAQQVTIKIGEKAYLLKNVYAYTRLIDEVEDLSWFSKQYINIGEDTVGLEKDIEFTKGVVSTVDSVYAQYPGYYLMTKNLDGSNYAGGEEDYKLESLRAGQVSHADTKGLGLTGVFDGNGYTISNIVVPTRGVFGLVSAGTVKNVAFKDTTLTGYYQCLVAHKVTNADIDPTIKDNELPTLMNVYIEGTNVTYTGSNGEIGIICQNNFFGYMRNVIINHTVSEGEKTKIEAGKHWGMFNSQYFYGNGQYDTRFSNVYFITDGPISLSTSTNIGWNKFLVAGNVVNVNADNKYELVDTTKFALLNSILTSEKFTWLTDVIKKDVLWNIDVLKTAKQYINAQDMAAAGNDYTSFDSAYWTIVDGVPTWNTLNA